MDVDKISASSTAVDKFLKGSEKWSLAGDAQLLEQLDTISNKLAANTHGVSERLRDLVTNVEVASVHFETGCSRYLSLANSQFIENRVYDDDVRVGANEKPADSAVPKSKEEKEQEYLVMIKQALNLSASVLTSHFNKIEINSETLSDDDLDSSFKPEPFYEHIDPYITRPLPLVIGSKAFFDNHLSGLQERTCHQYAEDDEDATFDVPALVRQTNVPEFSKADDASSVGKLEDDFVPQMPKSGSVSTLSSNSDAPPKALPPPVLPPFPLPVPTKRKSTLRSSIAESESSVSIAQAQEGDFKKNLSSVLAKGGLASSSVPSAKRNSSNFDSGSFEPPPFAASDSESDDGDLFPSIVKQARDRSRTTSTIKGLDERSMLSNNKPSVAAIGPGNRSGILDSDSDDDDVLGLFSNIRKKPTAKVKPAAPPVLEAAASPQTPNASTKSNASLTSKLSTAGSTKPPEVNSVTATSNGDNFKAASATVTAAKNQLRKESSSSEEDMFKPASLVKTVLSSAQQPVQSKPHAKRPVVTGAPYSATSIFDDEDDNSDDDLFAALSSQKRTTSIVQKKETSRIIPEVPSVPVANQNPSLTDVNSKRTSSVGSIPDNSQQSVVNQTTTHTDRKPVLPVDQKPPISTGSNAAPVLNKAPIGGVSLFGSGTEGILGSLKKQSAAKVVGDIDVAVEEEKERKISFEEQKETNDVTPPVVDSTKITSGDAQNADQRLPSLQKERVRIPSAARRPPTRKPQSILRTIDTSDSPILPSQPATSRLSEKGVSETSNTKTIDVSGFEPLVPHTLPDDVVSSLPIKNTEHLKAPVPKAAHQPVASPGFLDEDSDDGDLFSMPKKLANNTNAKAAVVDALAASANSTNNVFPSVSEKNVVSNAATTSRDSSETTPAQKSSLPALSGVATTAKSSLFSDDSDGDDIFADIVKSHPRSKGATGTTEPVQSKTSLPPRVSNVAVKEDSRVVAAVESSGKITSSQKPVFESTPKSAALFSESDDDDDIFSAARKPTDSVKSVNNSQTVISSSSSVNAKSNNNSNVVLVNRQPKSLFEDSDDDLDIFK